MHRRKLKYIFLIQVIVVSMLLTACWDKAEIDERAFVLALGVDHLSPEEKEKATQEQQELGGVAEAEPHYRVTYAFPKQMMAGGEATVENITMSSVGENIYVNERQMKSRVDNQLFLGHLKSVVLGEEVLKNPQMFREVLDALEKDPLISRKISLAIAQGDAKSVLAVQPKLQPSTGEFIIDLFQGIDRTNRAPVADLDDLLISLHNDGNAAIPRLVASKDELKVAGGAIVKNYEFAGWIGELESLGLLILLNDAGEYTVSINNGVVNFPYQVTESESKLSLVEGGEGITMKFDVEVEGDIMQYLFDTKEDVLDPVLLEEMERKIDKKIKAMLTETIEKLQKDLETDVLRIDMFLRRRKPDIWKSVEDNWEEVFPTIDIEVAVKSKIRRVGLSK